jgi:hypothetical protein
MKDEDLQVERCRIALYDLGSREGATVHGVIKQLKRDGFTADQISKAADKTL